MRIASTVILSLSVHTPRRALLFSRSCALFSRLKSFNIAIERSGDGAVSDGIEILLIIPTILIYIPPPKRNNRTSDSAAGSIEKNQDRAPKAGMTKVMVAVMICISGCDQ